MVLRSPRAACQKSRGRPDPVRARCLRPRDHRLVGRGERRYLRRDGTRSHGRCTPHPVEWLSDNGSAYIAKDTADIARALGLTLLFTPVRSPESNGISESFVKTLKRDYARLNILHDADAILAMLPNWIEDYCEIHPHSGLKFRSPREFIRLSA